MKNTPQAIVTISTTSYLAKVKALYHSLQGEEDFNFYCLVTDSNEVFQYENIRFINLEELAKNIPSKIYTKYKGDKLRWASKALFLQYILSTKEYEKAIYLDNDIYFFDSPSIIFQNLDQANFLLTPHYYQSSPQRKEEWFEANFRVGLYNAGFIACNQNALPILKWWSVACTYNMKKNYARGLFDDQKYLDLIPVLFDDVKVIKDRAWNLSAWNDENFDHIQNIPKENFQPLFIHFAHLTLEKWANPNAAFHQYYLNYQKALQEQDFKLSLSRKKHLIFDFIRYIYWRIQRIFEK